MNSTIFSETYFLTDVRRNECDNIPMCPVLWMNMDELYIYIMSCRHCRSVSKSGLISMSLIRLGISIVHQLEISMQETASNRDTPGACDTSQVIILLVIYIVVYIMHLIAYSVTSTNIIYPIVYSVTSTTRISIISPGNYHFEAHFTIVSFSVSPN